MQEYLLLDATDKILGELLQENELKKPRDQLSYNEIQAQIKTYSLEEIFNLIKKMIHE